MIVLSLVSSAVHMSSSTLPQVSYQLSISCYPQEKSCGYYKTCQPPVHNTDILLMGYNQIGCLPPSSNSYTNLVLLERDQNIMKVCKIAMACHQPRGMHSSLIIAPDKVFCCFPPPPTTTPPQTVYNILFIFVHKKNILLYA